MGGNVIAKSVVYFTKELTSEAVVRMYEKLGLDLPGKVAVKLHSGEVGNQNYLRPEFVAPMVKRVNGTVVECNTAYDGGRNTTEKHWKTMDLHGWSRYFTVDLLDAQGPDLELAIPDGKMIQKNFVGKNIQNYDSMLVLSHFKGHPMGGFGGALKQLSIGLASSKGKQYIHGVGDMDAFWTSDHDSFLMAMADAASSTVKLFPGKIAYVSVMKNLSVDCDCCEVAEDPCMADIGILSSLDPVALDRACLDLIYASKDPGRDHFLQRVESLNGALTIDAAAALGIGTKEYELVEV